MPSYCGPWDTTAGLSTPRECMGGLTALSALNWGNKAIAIEAETRGRDDRMAETLRPTVARKQPAFAALAALGVVYGDIGRALWFKTGR